MPRNLTHRSYDSEILDGPGIPEDVRRRCYRDLALTHRWLGNHRAILACIRRARPGLVLDIGCGHGALVQHIRATLGIEALGIDRNPPPPAPGIPILRADATRDPLPQAGLAVCLAMAHHLSEPDLIALIRNVGRSCGRFVILDLVRDRIPLVLFRAFVAPLVNGINVQDGIRSIERSFTPPEMKRIVGSALAGTPARFRHVVAPFRTRQIVDIVYAPE